MHAEGEPSVIEHGGGALVGRPFEPWVVPEARRLGPTTQGPLVQRGDTEGSGAAAGTNFPARRFWHSHSATPPDRPQTARTSGQHRSFVPLVTACVRRRLAGDDGAGEWRGIFGVANLQNFRAEKSLLEYLALGLGPP
jgi:hypothetical protein